MRASIALDCAACFRIVATFRSTAYVRSAHRGIFVATSRRTEARVSPFDLAIAIVNESASQRVLPKGCSWRGCGRSRVAHALPWDIRRDFGSRPDDLWEIRRDFATPSRSRHAPPTAGQRAMRESG